MRFPAFKYPEIVGAELDGDVLTVIYAGEVRGRAIAVRAVVPIVAVDMLVQRQVTEAFENAATGEK